MSGDPLFRMTVQDVFSIRGRGTVVTGKVETGSLKVGDDIQIVQASGSTKNAVVTGIEAFRKQMKEANAGDNIGVLLKDIAKGDVQQGDVLMGSGSGYGSDFTWKP